MKINKTAEELIQKLMDKHPHTLLTIGILKKGETSFKLFDASGEIPYESHLYEMGSIGKTFTTSLLAKYVAEGKINLEDSVAKYIPELDGDEKYYPTLKRLATHTAGYPTRYPIDDWSDMAKLIKIIMTLPFKPQSASEFPLNKEKLIRLTKQRKLKDKDYGWMYANFGIALIGLAVSNVAGMSFSKLLAEYFREELKLESSFVGVGHKRLLTGFDKKNRDIGNYLPDEEEWMIPPGYGMISNAEDLLEYAKMNIDGCPSYLGLCHENYAKGDEDYKMDMGLGWWLNSREKLFWHGGNTDGFSTALMFSKEKESAIVILMNVADYKERELITNAVWAGNWEN